MSAPAAEIRHPAPHRNRVPFAILILGIFVAPVAWDLQILIGSALAGHICYPAGEQLQVPLWGGQFWTLLIIDIIGIVGSLVGLGLALGAWGRVRQERADHDVLDVGEGRTRWMAMAGILVSCLFLLALIFASAQIFFFPLCT